MSTTLEPETDASRGDRVFAFIQERLPTRALSSLIHWLMGLESPLFTRLMIGLFQRLFPQIDLGEAQRRRPAQYRSFNDFFTRALAPDARPLAPEPHWVCPVDGTVSQLGTIRQGQLIQAKGHRYSSAELLTDPALAGAFEGGEFCTIYLAPYNYHRIHLPQTGELRDWLYVPGRLFSVNAATARALPRLFARNERVVTIWDTAQGPFALVMVGALFVGSMETVWTGKISPPHRRGEVERYQPIHPTRLARGAEMGRFNMGSTVILLSARGRLRYHPSLQPGQPVRMGQALAEPV
ncbi:MAG TPA: archaetidylserine decarboxylase [Nevskiaceae bacterium]|nr:archaetidylserine decarboxylase [Nevskiaceae bacterium]